MEIRISGKVILIILQVLSWILFIGLCLEAGIFLFNAFYPLIAKPEGYKYVNLDALYNYDKVQFFTMLVLMSIAAVLKALIFYLIIKLLHDKKFNLARPFSNEMRTFILKMGWLALGTGFFSYWGVKNSRWLTSKGIAMPDAEVLRIGGADVWLFMSVSLFVIAQIFKRGIEIQSENELTI